MTVRDWIAQRTTTAPTALVAGMFDALGDDSGRPAHHTADACVSAASRLLERIVSEQRYGRETALPLLVVDALTTVAYEHAAESGGGIDAIDQAATRGVRTLSATSLARV